MVAAADIVDVIADIEFEVGDASSAYQLDEHNMELDYIVVFWIAAFALPIVAVLLTTTVVVFDTKFVVVFVTRLIFVSIINAVAAIIRTVVAFAFPNDEAS